MKTINDLKDELSIQFGSLLTGIGPTELNTVLAFILTSFAHDFPEVNSRAYKLLDSTSIRVYLEEINDNFIELKYQLPLQKISTIAKQFYERIYSLEECCTEIDEVYAIQLTNDFIEKNSTYAVPRKPMVLSDGTSEFVSIDRDSVIVYLTERVIDPNYIKDYVYSILRVYSCYKFVDYTLNRQFSNFLDVNQKVFDLIYGAINEDITSGDLEQVTSVSLSGLSVSFASKLTGYSSTLSQLASGFSNPTLVQEMNKMRDNYKNQFKRKKNVFYNYVF